MKETGLDRVKLWSILSQQRPQLIPQTLWCWEPSALMLGALFRVSLKGGNGARPLYVCIFWQWPEAIPGEDVWFRGGALFRWETTLIAVSCQHWAAGEWVLREVQQCTWHSPYSAAWRPELGWKRPTACILSAFLRRSHSVLTMIL